MTGSRVVVDTSIVVALLRGDRRVARRFDESGEIMVPFAARAELLSGAMKSGNRDKNLRDLDALFGRYTGMESSPAVSQMFADIKTALASKGRLIPINDIWIAACALAAGLPVAARDEHFGWIDGLEVLDW